MSSGFRHIKLDATAVPTGQALLIPRSGTGGGGQFGANITDHLRTFAMTREAIGYRVVFTVAHDIFDNWFNLKVKDAEDEESNPFDEAIQKKLSLLHAKRELTKMAVYERGYGWSILVLGYVDGADSLEEPVVDPTDLLQIQAYAPTHITSVKEDKKQENEDGTPNFNYGFPELYNITQKGMAQRLKVHHTRTILFNTRLIDHEWKGKSCLDPLWDDLTTIRNIVWGMGQTMFRYGSGFPDITLTGPEKEKIDEYIDSGAFENLSARTYFVHNEKQQLEFKGVAGRALNPEWYYLPPMERISTASGIPLAILRGVQAGALTGSEVNERQYANLISDEQTAYEDGVRKLIDIIVRVAGEDSLKSQDYSFDWKSIFEATEKEKLEVQKLKTDIVLSKAPIMTRNELRKLMDPKLKELSEDQGGNEIIGRNIGFGPSYTVTENQPKQNNRSR